jgi:hypothetical protein
MEVIETTKPKSLYADAVKHGLIVGVITILLTIIAYSASVSFMASIKFLGSVFFVYIGYVIYAGITYRNRTGGYISYGSAFIHGFIILAVAGLVNFLFSIILHNVIDPGLSARLTEAILANTEDTMRNFGVPEDSIDETLSDLRRDLPEGFTMTGRILNYFQGLIWYGVIVLITSLIVKKNEPVEI